MSRRLVPSRWKIEGAELSAWKDRFYTPFTVHSSQKAFTTQELKQIDWLIAQHKAKMPRNFKRRFSVAFPNRGGYPRRRFKRKKVSIPAAARGYLRQGGYYGKGRGELKFLDTAISDSTLAATMVQFNTVVIPQGDTESTRIGRKCRLKSLSIKGQLTLAGGSTAGQSSAYTVMKVILDTQTNGGTFAATDLLETDVVASFNNLANSSRFRTLKTKKFSMSAGGAAASGAAYIFGEVVRNIDVHIPLNLIIEYDNSATTGAIGTVRSNSLWVVFQGNTAEAVGVDAQARVRFTDS